MDFRTSFSSSSHFAYSSAVHHSTSELESGSSSRIFTSFKATVVSPFSCAVSVFFSKDDAEVANPPVTPITNTALIITANLDVFFIFIIALILSSIAFLLKLLHNGVSPLFFSSIDIKAVAYTDFISIPNLRTTVSSQDNSKSLLKRIYITHTSGLNQ